MDLGLRLEEMNKYSDKHQSGKTKICNVCWYASLSRCDSSTKGHQGDGTLRICQTKATRKKKEHSVQWKISKQTS